MKRIGLSGTEWTGKTTTISRLKAQLKQDCDVVALSELVRKCPYPMIREQTLEGSQWMIDSVLKILRREPIVPLQIFDRTPLDILAFTYYAGYRTGHEHDSLSRQAFELVGHFDQIFFVRPNHEWPPGMTPSPTDIGFALMIDFFMFREAKRWSVNTTELPWNLDDRLKLLRSYVGASMNQV